MWSPVNPFNAMLSRQGVAHSCGLTGAPSDAVPVLNATRGITPFLRFSGLIVVCRVLCTVTINHYGE